jgi:rod shape-determining protein MreC
LDDKGLIGQTTHVGPWSADVIMITDPEHGVPVRIERTGLRTIAVGAGDTTSLALPYLPANADVKAGDLLVTSGLGGVFPEGYPVARVTEVHRDAVQPLAQVRAAPLAHVDTDTEVMLVWFRPDHPAAPAAPVNAAGELPSGSAAMHPQLAPPKPAAPSPGQDDSDSDAPPMSAPPPGENEPSAADSKAKVPAALHPKGKPAKPAPAPPAHKPGTPP